MNGEVNCCWGNPDEVYYTVDGDKKLYQLDLRCNGHVFGIWDGVFLMGNYNDDTDWMMHDEFIIYYIYYNLYSLIIDVNLNRFTTRSNKS